MLVRVLLAAIFAGVLAGVFSTVVQSYRVIPLIVEAEKYEDSEVEDHAQESQEGTQEGSQEKILEGSEKVTDEGPEDSKESTTDQPAGTGHEHSGEAWAPEDGFERSAFTLLSNVLVGVSFALILTGGILLSPTGISVQIGLAWGACGFFVFVLAPNFGLPPELPGMEAAGVRERQVWWLATVVLTAGGLALFAFKRGLLWMVLGVVFLLAPHLYGAPQPTQHDTAVPANLAVEFVTATMVSSALFWLFLGGVLGLFQNLAMVRD